MLRCFLSSNVNTQISDYLREHRIVNIVQECVTFDNYLELKETIINVDKLIYIYYTDQSSDLAFKTDLSHMRNLLSSVFFSAKEILFILIKPTAEISNFLSEVKKDFPLPVEVVERNSNLALPELAGIIGQVSVSDNSTVYSNVYFSKIGSLESERFTNTPSKETFVETVRLDEHKLYHERVKSFSEAINNQEDNLAHQVDEIKSSNTHISNQLNIEIISGNIYTDTKIVACRICEHLMLIGKRVLMINLMDKDFFLDKATLLSLEMCKFPFKPETPLVYLPIHPNYLPLLISYLKNIHYLTDIVILTPVAYVPLLRAIAGNPHHIHIIHNTERDILNLQVTPNTLLIQTDWINIPFDIQSYKTKTSIKSCALFSKKDACSTSEEYARFYHLCIRGGDPKYE